MHAFMLMLALTFVLALALSTQIERHQDTHDLVGGLRCRATHLSITKPAHSPCLPVVKIAEVLLRGHVF